MDKKNILKTIVKEVSKEVKEYTDWDNTKGELKEEFESYKDINLLYEFIGVAIILFVLHLIMSSI